MVAAFCQHPPSSPSRLYCRLSLMMSMTVLKMVVDIEPEIMIK